ncbi:MAG: WecB/TagA/CpsF family glycosyltransferase [Candidatus Moraniibacteriota bacterium]
MSERSRNEVLGIPIDSRSQVELERVIIECLGGESFVRIATINPEFLVCAYRDTAFADVLRSADIRVADGSGIVLAGLLSGFGVSRYPGADLMRFILSEGERTGASVFLATRKDGLSWYMDVREAVMATYPTIVLDGADIDPESDTVPEGVRDASIVLCNFGAPEQELFVESLRARPGNIRLVMGVGGSFDFLTGKRKRAPRWMRSLGLEWLFRLVIQPSRVGRIWTSTVVFPFLCLSDRMKDRKQLTDNKEHEHMPE